MSRECVRYVGSYWRFPRVSGDEPGERDPIERYGVFSPRERG